MWTIRELLHAVLEAAKPRPTRTQGRVTTLPTQSTQRSPDCPPARWKVPLVMTQRKDQDPDQAQTRNRVAPGPKSQKPRDRPLRLQHPPQARSDALYGQRHSAQKQIPGALPPSSPSPPSQPQQEGVRLETGVARESSRSAQNACSAENQRAPEEQPGLDAGLQNPAVHAQGRPGGPENDIRSHPHHETAQDTVFCQAKQKAAERECTDAAGQGSHRPDQVGLAQHPRRNQVLVPTEDAPQNRRRASRLEATVLGPGGDDAQERQVPVQKHQGQGVRLVPGVDSKEAQEETVEFELVFEERRAQNQVHLVREAQVTREQDAAAELQDEVDLRLIYNV